MNKTLLEAYKTCIKKVHLHIEELNGELYEYSGACLGGDYCGECGKNKFLEMYNWTTSFVTGLAPLVYRTEKDDRLLKWANSFSSQYYDKIFNHNLDTMHDIGFLYYPFSVAMWNLTGEIAHKNTAIKAADELAKRFDVNGHYINAWARMSSQSKEGLAIIDCMMNIPLLFWAWKETGHRFYYDVAVSHANTTMNLFVREDYSVCHAYLFDRITGEAIGEANHCGYGIGSHWARGTAWAIYGFALAARYTGKKEYLNTAINISEKFIENLKEDDFIPVWDFRLPKDRIAKICGEGNALTIWDEADMENKKYNRDTSAAAIAVCGFLEINKIVDNKILAEYSEKILSSLVQKYMNFDENKTGMLSHSNGCMTYTTFGDYYFMKALQKFI